MRPVCPYCGAKAELVTGADIYPHLPRLHAANFWRCAPCAAYVGCHRTGDGIKPMGTLADARTRDLRRACHARFDPLWRSGGIARKGAYKALARRLGIPFKDCHFSWFQAPELERALVAIGELAAELAPDVPHGTVREVSPATLPGRRGRPPGTARPPAPQS